MGCHLCLVGLQERAKIKGIVSNSCRGAMGWDEVGWTTFQLPLDLLRMKPVCVLRSY